MKSRTAAEKIGDLLGVDALDVKDGRYQRGTLSNPSVYVLGDDYYAAGNKKPAHTLGQPWVKKTTWRGDVVWESKMEQPK